LISGISTVMSKLTNVLKTLMENEKMSESELARRTNIGQSVINRLASGAAKNPTLFTLNTLAKYFHISTSQLIGEDVLFKKTVWKSVPLLSMEYIPDWLEKENDRSNAVAVMVDIDIGNKAYAIKMKGSAMYPRFPENTILIIDPSVEPEDRDFGVVYLEKQATFKQILIDGSDIYLKPLNPDFKTIFLNADYQFLGIMVQAKMNFKNKP